MKGENAMSRKGSDETRPGNTKTVSGIERVGGKGHGTHSFNVPNHPEKCDVAKGPGGKMDR